jgi:anti-sigma regulatory factor (Ser/Thr protein kinase)
MDLVASAPKPLLGSVCREHLLDCWVRTEFYFQLENDPAAIRPLVLYLQQHASSMRALDDAESTRLGIALHEALKNAIEHGNLELSSTLREFDGRDGSTRYEQLVEARRRREPYCRRRVWVTVRESRYEARYTIRDEGPGFEKPLLQQDPTRPENIGRQGGRGLFLIQAFMDEVTHNEAGNEITMTHRRGGGRRVGDCTGPSADEKLAAADYWWVLPQESAKFRSAMQARAAHLYSEALAQLPAGMEKIRAEVRIREAESRE